MVQAVKRSPRKGLRFCVAHANRLTVRLLESEQLDDQFAALAYVKRLPIVDPQRIVAAGCSYGGIETLLGAESRLGYKAAISISPAALSWDGNDYLKARLVQAVSRPHQKN